jgi:hypothetical protein
LSLAIEIGDGPFRNLATGDASESRNHKHLHPNILP